MYILYRFFDTSLTFNFPSPTSEGTTGLDSLRYPSLN